MTEDRFTLLRMIEAILFAAAEPQPLAALARRLPEGTDVKGLVDELKALYANRGVNLLEIDGRFAFRTAVDLASRLQIEREVPKKLSRAALETLAIIAYHQPVTRAEIEEIRGVALSKGTLDTLMEIGWVEPKGHRRTAGRPATWRTTPAFLDQFGLESLADLPGVEELKAAGLLDARPAISALGTSAAAASHRIDDAEEGEEEAAGEEGAEAASAAGTLVELASIEEGEERPSRVEQALAEPA